MVTERCYCISAGPQESVPPNTCPYQTVKIDGKRYCLTCLGFGLNVAPLIMKAIVSAVMSQEEAMGRAASADIDDSYVNKDVVPATCIREHLAQFGLKCKDPEQLEDGAQVLGLAVRMEHSELRRKCSSRSSQYCYATNSILLVWATCRASSSVRLASHGLRNTQEASKLSHEGLG